MGSTMTLNPQPTPFCDSETVRRAFAGKRVALVGSGPGVLDNKEGFVDSHEVVVRVNNYKIGAPQGRRCDVFYSFFGTSVRKSAAELKRDGVRLCVCKCPDAQFMESAWHCRRGRPHGVDFSYIYRARQAWWFCETYVPTTERFLEWFNLLGGHVPTTGFAALLEILSHEPASVYMTGFDFFQSRVHNVNERWRPGDPSDPIGHAPERERQWVLRNTERLTFDPALTRALRR